MKIKVKHVSHLIEADCLLWIEEGDEPLPGAILLTLEQWSLETSDTEHAGPADCFNTLPLFPIEFSKRSTLRELKIKVLERLIAAEESEFQALGRPTKGTADSFVRIWHQKRLLTEDGTFLCLSCFCDPNSSIQICHSRN